MCAFVHLSDVLPLYSECYDQYLFKSLHKAAEERGHLFWAGGPDNVGSYNSRPHENGSSVMDIMDIYKHLGKMSDDGVSEGQFYQDIYKHLGKMSDDGVSEGQFYQVQRTSHELDAIRKKRRQTIKSSHMYAPVTFVVVQKRLQTIGALK
nr:Beta-amylase 7 [Ipomoea batatas]